MGKRQRHNKGKQVSKIIVPVFKGRKNRRPVLGDGTKMEFLLFVGHEILDHVTDPEQLLKDGAAGFPDLFNSPSWLKERVVDDHSWRKNTRKSGLFTLHDTVISSIGALEGHTVPPIVGQNLRGIIGIRGTFDMVEWRGRQTNQNKPKDKM
jgi:hypothetical protein